MVINARFHTGNLQPEYKTVVLRHDVDRKPGNALVIAEIEQEAGGRRSEAVEQRDGWMNPIGWMNRMNGSKTMLG